IKLDEWNKKILYELEKDASIGLKDLSRKIGRSKEFISYRIKILEHEGIINGYTAIVDMSKLGYFTFRIYLKFQNSDEQDIKEVINFLKEKEKVWTIAKLHGKWDYAFFVGAKQISDFHDIWNSFLDNFKDRIKESKIAIYSRIHNFNKRFFVSSEAVAIERVIGVGGQENVDDTDLAIINEWGKNVRQSAVEVGEKLKISPKTVSNRLKVLRKKKIIAGCKIDIDQSKLGYQGYRVDISLNNTIRKNELFAYCKKLQNIYQINDSIGGADLELEIIVKDLDELLNIMNSMIVQFKGTIRDYEYFSFLVFPKLTIVPD
ncbi:MAG: Lrp/AsnC family transcriptional regulator, partial [Candidatus Aenigmarchaeota archaeon]|nr:Lrp/AsnC family transcriptional regulator [Candidatus Aenigmarchaeota archaeon]